MMPTSAAAEQGFTALPDLVDVPATRSGAHPEIGGSLEFLEVPTSCVADGASVQEALQSCGDDGLHDGCPDANIDPSSKLNCPAQPVPAGMSVSIEHHGCQGMRGEVPLSCGTSESRAQVLPDKAARHSPARAQGCNNSLSQDGKQTTSARGITKCPGYLEGLSAAAETAKAILLQTMWLTNMLPRYTRKVLPVGLPALEAASSALAFYSREFTRILTVADNTVQSCEELAVDFSR